MEVKLIKVFVKKNCEKCDVFKETILPKIKEKWKVKTYDLGTPDGLAESVYFNIMFTPTVIVEENGKEVKRYNSILEAERDLVILTKENE